MTAVRTRDAAGKSIWKFGDEIVTNSVF